MATIAMATIALTVEYDGLKFCGYQSQPNVRTVEDELKRAISLALRDEVPVIYSAGRTDAGVHARGQVVSFSTMRPPSDLNQLVLAVSGLLRPDLAVTQAKLVAEDFHARKSAQRKQYSYHILNRIAPPVLDYGRVWHVSAELDLAAMQEAASSLLGEHDFSAFRTGPAVTKSSIRTIFESEVSRVGERVVYRVIGSGFLRHMVRGIVGTLVQFATHQSSSSMAEIISSGGRKSAGPNAPAHGLYLDWVEY